MAAVGYKKLAQLHGLTEEQVVKVVGKMPKRKIGYVRLDKVGEETTRNGNKKPLFGFIADDERFAESLGSLSGSPMATYAKMENKKGKKDDGNNTNPPMPKQSVSRRRSNKGK